MVTVVELSGLPRAERALHAGRSCFCFFRLGPLIAQASKRWIWSAYGNQRCI